MQKLSVLAITVIAAFQVCTAAYGQFNSGLEGTVRDPSGALIPNASVSITNVQQGVSRKTNTNDGGFFRIESMAPGTYQVKVLATGFKGWNGTDLVLQAGEFRTLAISLELGATSSVVSVSAQAAAVTLENADTGTVIQTKNILQIPLVGNSVYSLAAIGPGVTGGPTANSNNFGGGTAQGGVAGDNYSNNFYAGINAAGQRQESTNFTFDGATILVPSQGGLANLSPNPEIVDQMLMSVTEFSATKGRNSGANIEVFSKSGTNQWHGSAFWAYTDNDLSSKTEFETAVPAFIRNEYGASGGGPIIKDKTFVFGSFSQLRESSPASGTAAVETEDFANYVQTAFPNSPQAMFFKIAPPQHYPDCATSSCTSVGALQSQSYFPDPTIPSSLDAIGIENYSYSIPRTGTQWNVRVDQYLGQKDRIFGNFLRVSSSGVSADPRPTLNVSSPAATDFLSLNYTHTFSPTLLNEAGFSRVLDWGITPSSPTMAIPYVSIGSVAGSSEWGPGNYVQTGYEWRDVISKSLTHHTLKFGYEAETEGENDQQNGAFTRPTFTFQSLIDFAQGKAFSESGSPLNLANGQAAVFHMISRTLYSSLYAEDNWKVNPRLTINLGLRYDDNGHYIHITSPAISFFSLGSGSTINEQIANGVLAPRAGNPSGLNLNATTNRLWEVNPRFGFAYDLFGDGRTAIRGGLGLFSDKLPYLNVHGVTNLPFFYTPSVSVLQNQSPTFVLCSPPQPDFNQSCPLLPLPSVEFDSHGGIVGQRASVGAFSTKITPAQVEVWSLSIQRQIRRNLLFEIDYFGSAGHHLSNLTDVNRYAGDLVANGGQQNRLNQSFGPIEYLRTDGNSIANLGSAMFTKRISHGYNVRAIYTWSKVLDSPSSSDDTGIGASNLVDAQNYKLMRGRADFDVRSRFTLDGVWTLPNPWKDGWKAATIGGWGLGTIAILQSGTPFSVYSTNSYASGLGDFNADGVNYDYPDTPSFGNHVSSPSKSKFLNGLFPASAFPLPTPGSGEGNLGRNTFDEPGYADVDLNAEKVFTTPWFGGEKLNTEFRAEVFNLFNRVNLHSVDGNLADATFGRSLGQYAPRIVQMKLRLQF